jgi:hypothetical protein
MSEKEKSSAGSEMLMVVVGGILLIYGLYGIFAAEFWLSAGGNMAGNRTATLHGWPARLLGFATLFGGLLVSALVTGPKYDPARSALYAKSIPYLWAAIAIALVSFAVALYLQISQR